MDGLDLAAGLLAVAFLLEPGNSVGVKRLASGGADATLRLHLRPRFPEEP